MLTSTALGAGATLAGGALLAACAGQGGQTAAGSAQPATVTYLHFDTGQQVWQDSWKQIFDGFAAKYPGSKVQADLVTQALTNISQKGIATYAAGGTYDLFYGHFTILSEFLSADIIEPLDAPTSPRTGTSRPTTTTRRRRSG